MSALPILVKTEKLATDLGVSKVTLAHGRLGKGEFSTLPFVKIGRFVRYDIAVVKKWLDEHRIG